jgi:hypothetical protein
MAMRGWLAMAAVTAGVAAWVGLGGDTVAGKAPAGPGIRSARWINSPPLSPQSLRGKVVAVEFWTYG